MQQNRNSRIVSSCAGKPFLSGTGRFLIVTLVALLGSALRAGDGGSLLGTIADPSGTAVPGAMVTLTETATGEKQTIATDGHGFSSFQSLPIGRYDLEVNAPGFKPLRRTGVAIDVNSKVVVDATLVIGEKTEAITVSESGAHVETADTQMGQVITGKQMTAVPLNGRSYTDLLGLQAGVVPSTSLTSNTTQDVGVSAFSPSGDLSPGTISINGQREFANSFVLNGSDVEEDVNMGAAIIPNLDSIAEFRILTSNFDAEHGEFSGGQIERGHEVRDQCVPRRWLRIPAQHRISMPAIIFLLRAGRLTRTSSGARWAVRSARTRFSSSPIIRARDRPRESTRARSPFLRYRIAPAICPMLASSFMTDGQDGKPVPTTVSGPYWASQLSQKLGYAVTAGEPYYSPGCTSAAQCVLPNAVIPKSAWSAPATNLLQYIPAPNNPNGTFSTSSYNETLAGRQRRVPAGWHNALGIVVGLLLFWTTGRRTIRILSLKAARMSGFQRPEFRPRAITLPGRHQNNRHRPPSTNSTSASCATQRISASRLAASAQAWRRKGSWWARIRPASFRYRPKPKAWRASISTTSPSEPTQTS